MAQDNRKKLSAKSLALDIRSGASDSDLKEKYGLSDSHLHFFFKMLIDLGRISVEDLDNRCVGSSVAGESRHISPSSVQPETETKAKPQQTLQTAKDVMAQSCEQMPPGSDVPMQTPTPKTGETFEQILDKFLATVTEVSLWLPDGKSKLYNYFIKPVLFLCAFVVLFVVALVKPEHWWNERWRVYTLLVLFFPLAIYGAWRSEVMSRKEKGAIIGFLILAPILGKLIGK